MSLPPHSVLQCLCFVFDGSSVSDELYRAKGSVLNSDMMYVPLSRAPDGCLRLLEALPVTARFGGTVSSHPEEPPDPGTFTASQSPSLLMDIQFTGFRSFPVFVSASRNMSVASGHMPASRAIQNGLEGHDGI